MILKKIISGGQTGADQAGLAAAKYFGIKTGGFAPKGFLTKEGPKKFLLQRDYGLIESTGGYKTRTWENIEASDATIRLAIDFSTAGEVCTRNGILQYNKPYFDVNLNNPISEKACYMWLMDFGIKTLNVAGNTDLTHGQDIFTPVFEYMCNVFKLLKGQ